MSELDRVKTSVQSHTTLHKIQENPSRDGVAGSIYRQDQKSEALRDFDLETKSEDLRAWLGQALLLVDNGDYRLAQAILRKILEQNPYYADAIRWQSYCFRQIEDFENAIRCATALSKLEPGEESFCLLAELFYTVGRDPDAIVFYEKALSQIEYESPHLFEIYKNLGNICLKAGNIDAAEENYNRAFRLSPHSDILLVNFGTLEIQRKNYVSAGTRFREAIALNQNNDKAWVGLALIFRQNSDTDLAWGNLEKALDLNPKNETALSLAIQWGIDDWRLEVPIRRLTDYVGSQGQDSNMSYSLAALLFQAGRVNEAKLEIERTLILDPSRRDAQDLRALIRARGR
jgi:tetratricopeptide (TPR) repeat protein